MILLAASAAAKVTVTYSFYDASTAQPLNNVDVLGYPCNDDGCNSLNLNSLLSGSGNSGAASTLSLIFPTNLATPYGYALYYFRPGYAPQEYKATWNGNGQTSYNIPFNKISNCKANITNPGIDVNSTTGEVEATSVVRSAFTDPHNGVGYVPVYYTIYYSSSVRIDFDVLDEDGNVVFHRDMIRNIYMDQSYAVRYDFVLQPGNYTAVWSTNVIDSKCSSSIGQTRQMNFEVPGAVPPQESINVTLIAPPNGTVADQANITFMFNATDNLVSQLNCSLYLNGTVIGTATAINNTQTSINTSNLEDGIYLWNVICSNGNVTGTAPEDFMLVINTTQPVLPECSDGMDNDGDGLIDYPADLGCVNATDDDETDFVCTNHLNITMVEMETVEIFGGLTYPLGNSTIANGYIPFNYYAQNTGNTAVFLVNFTMTMSNQTDVVAQDTSGTPIINANATYVEGQNFDLPANLSDGLYNMSLFVNGVDEQNCSQFDSFYFSLLVNTTAPDYECSDGYDNDNDTLTDAADPGCYDSGAYDPFDDDENDTLPECSDYFDNDNDSFIDYPADPGCINPADDNESGTEMLDVELTANPMSGIEPLNASFNCTALNGNAPYNYSLYSDASLFYNALSATSVTTTSVFNDGLYNVTCFANDTNGRFGYDSLLINASNQTNQTDNAPAVTLLFPANNSVLSSGNVMFIYEVQDDLSQILNCTLYTNLTGTFIPSQSQLTVNGFMGVFSVSNVSEGSYVWNVLCDDGTNSAFALENFTFTVNSSYVDIDADVNITANPSSGEEPLSVQFNSTVAGNMPITYSWSFGDSQTSSSANPLHIYSNAGTYTAILTITDADGDTASDSVTITVTEATAPSYECSDGMDNDGDGLIDMNDLGCESPEDDDESDETTPNYDLYIGRIIIYSDLVDAYGEEYVKQGDELFVNVYFENTGDFDLDDLEFRALILDLGLSNSVTFDLKEGDHTTKTVMIDIPSDVAPGNYDIQILVYNEEISRVKYRLVIVIS